MDGTALYEELAANPLAVEIWRRDKFESDSLLGVARVRLDDVFSQPSQHGPNGSSLQTLDQKYLIVNPENPSGTRRRMGEVRIMLSLEKLSAGANLPQHVSQRGSYGGAGYNPAGSYGGGGGGYGPSGPERGPEYSTAWELEMWKAAEEAKWRAELAEKEHARMAALEAEWKSREQEREAEVGRVKAEYARLEAKLKSHLLDIEKREPRLALAEKEIERERERMRMDAEHKEKNRQEEMQRVVSKYKNDLVMNKMRLTESQNFSEALEQKLRDAELRNHSMDKEFQEFKRRSNNSSEAKLHQQIAEMAQQRVLIEREKDGAMQQKRQYKEQLVRALRELQQLKLTTEREKELRLQHEKQELDAMRLQFYGQEQNRALHADRTELDGIKQQLAQLSGGPAYRADFIHEMPPGSVAVGMHQGMQGPEPDLARLIRERDELLRTGNYSQDDKLVRRLSSEIERVSQLRARPPPF